MTVWPPKLDAPGVHARSVQITDPKLRHALTIAPQDTYRLLGGTDGEWMAHGMQSDGRASYMLPSADEEKIEDCFICLILLARRTG